MGERLGFIGLGIMGLAMVHNLAGEEPLTVYNRTAARLDLRPPAAIVKSSPKAVAEASDVIFLMVSNNDAVRAVVEGPEGLLAGLTSGTTIIDHSTISPVLTREMASQALRFGAHWCDAPVTGGDVGAREGTLTIMVGSDDNDFERIQPYLRRMGQRIYHVGQVGQGQSLKLVANMVSAMNLMAASEGIQLGLQLGLALDDISDVMTHGSAQSFELSKVLDRFRKDHYAPGFSVENRYKDLRLAVQLADEVNFSADLAQAADELLARHRDRGFSQYDEASYILKWSQMKGE